MSAGEWTLTEPGLPPLPDGRTPTPRLTPAEVRDYRRRSARWIADLYPGAVKRGRVARRQVADITDGELFGGRRELARKLRDLAEEELAGPARSAVAIRASLIELAENAEAVRALLVEVAAIGVQVGRRPR